MVLYMYIIAWAVVAKEQEGENIEVRKIKALIFQDKKNAEAKVAKARAEVDAVKVRPGRIKMRAS
jgi:hypothetical protein